MAITKCPISDAGSEPLHNGNRRALPVWPHQRRMVHVAWMEMIMSTYARYLPANPSELQDDDLDAVSGGSFPLPARMTAVLNDLRYPSRPPCGAAAGYDSMGHPLNPASARQPGHGGPISR